MDKNDENKPKTRTTIIFIKKVLSVIFYIVFSSIFIIKISKEVGLPISRETFITLLPSMITLVSITLVFYNVNRTQKKSYENDEKKFVRDIKSKVADKLIEAIVEFDEVISEIDQAMHKIGISKEEQITAEYAYQVGREVIKSYNNKMLALRTIILQNEHVIRFHNKKNILDSDKNYNMVLGSCYEQMLDLSFTFMFNELVFNDRPDRSAVYFVLEDLKCEIKDLSEELRTHVVENLYGDLFTLKVVDEKPSGLDNILAFIKDKNLRLLSFLLILLSLTLLLPFIKMVFSIFIY